MFKKLTFVLAFAALLSAATAAALEPMPGRGAANAVEEQALVRELDSRLKTNEAFLKAAGQIVEASGSASAAAILERARISHGEALTHKGAGEHKDALSHIYESTQLAVHAVVVSKDGKNGSLKNAIIREEIFIKENRDRERKAALFNKGIAEVKVFIDTAERLSGGNAQAAKEIKEAKDLFEAAKADGSNGLYDEANAKLDKAYAVSTRVVKDLKRVQGDIITFPKQALTDEKDTVAYELKKNDSYIFFAKEVIKESDKDGVRSIEKARELRKEALDAIDKDEAPRAIEKLKASTDILIKAIKDDAL